MKYLFLIFFFGLSTLCFSQPDCKFLKDCELKYADGNTGTIVINGNKHVESLEGGKYFIKSDLVWISDCEYNATMTEITLPDFPFKPGEVMNVKFEKIDGTHISGTGSVRGKKFPIAFTRVR